MYKVFSARLCSVVFLLPLCISGCNIAGGGFVHYHPPKTIVCGQPWVITIGYSVIPVDPKEKRGKLAEEWKDVTIHIRDSLNGNFLAVPMVVESVNPEIGKMYLNASMKPIPCNSGIEYVEYYVDNMTRHIIYNRSRLYKIPVGKD